MRKHTDRKTRTAIERRTARAAREQVRDQVEAFPFCQPAGYAGPYTQQQLADFLASKEEFGWA